MSSDSDEEVDVEEEEDTSLHTSSSDDDTSSNNSFSSDESDERKCLKSYLCDVKFPEDCASSKKSKRHQLQKVTVLKTDTYPWCLSVTKDEKYLITGEYDGNIAIFSVKDILRGDHHHHNQQPIQRLCVQQQEKKKHDKRTFEENNINSINHSEDGKFLFSASDDGYIRTFARIFHDDDEKAQELLNKKKIYVPVFSEISLGDKIPFVVKQVPSKTCCFVAGEEEKKEEEKESNSASASNTNTNTNINSSIIAVGSQGGIVSFFDFKLGVEVFEPLQHASSSSIPTQVVPCSNFENAHAEKIEERMRKKKIFCGCESLEKTFVFDFDFVRDGRRIVTGGSVLKSSVVVNDNDDNDNDDNKKSAIVIKLWDWKQNQLLCVFPLFDVSPKATLISALSTSKCSRFLAVGLNDNSCFVLRLARENWFDDSEEDHNNSNTSSSNSSNGCLLVDTHVKTTEVQVNRNINKLAGTNNSSNCYSDEKKTRIVTTTSVMKLRGHPSLGDGQSVCNNLNGINSIGWSNSDALISASTSNQVRVWCPFSSCLLATPETLDDNVWSSMFFPTLPYLCACTNSSKVFVYKSPVETMGIRWKRRKILFLLREFSRRNIKDSMSTFNLLVRCALFL